MFEANGEIGDMVDFYPTYRQATRMGIDVSSQLYGQIVGVRFTKAKVWYDVVCDYYGVVFSKIPSEKVTSSEVLIKMEN